MIKEWRLTGIFAKLTVTMLIVVIPLYLIGIWMNQSGEEAVKRETYQVMVQKSDFVMSSIESEFKQIAQLQKQFLSDSDLQDLSIRSSSLSVYEWTKSVNDLFSKLSILAASSKYVKEAFVIMPIANRRLSSISRLEDMNLEEWEKLSQPLPNQYINFLVWRNRLYMPLGYPINSRSQYMLVLEISTDAVRRDLRYFDNSGNDVNYLIDNRNSHLFSDLPDEANYINAVARHPMTGPQSIQIEGGHYLLIDKYSELLGWTLVSVLSEKELLAPVQLFRQWYWELSALSVIVIVIVSFIIYRLIHRPMQKLISAFRRVEQGRLDIVITRKGKDEFRYLYEQFNEMLMKVRQLIQEVYEQTIRSQKAELKQLQSQINPHFFYNSLYILYRMAQNEDFEGVSTLSRHLGDYYKFITQNQSDLISLEQEIHHAQTYVAIQQTRFGDRIACRFEISGDVSAWEVPRLILQPLLENSFIHGFASINTGGDIRVRVIAKSDRCLFEVKDNGCGMSRERLEEWDRMRRMTSEQVIGNGMWNVHRRLALHYGEESGIRLEPGSDGGLVVTMNIQRGGRT